MTHSALRPSVYVYRPIASQTSIQPKVLRDLARSYDIHGIRLARAQSMAATIMGSGEVLDVYKYCQSWLSPDDATELGDALHDALPATADAYIEVPMTLHWRPAPSTRRSDEACIIMAPSDTVQIERTVLQETITDFVASRLGCIGMLAESYAWRERLPGVRIASGHRTKAIADFYEILQCEAASVLPESILYEPVSIDDV